MKEIGAALYLGMLSIWDIRSQKLPVGWLIPGGAGASLCLLEGIMTDGMAVGEVLGRMLPGVIVLLLAYMTHQAGEGDGWLLLMVGCIFPYRSCMAIFLGSLLLAALTAAGMMAAGKMNRDARLPYVPFLWAAVLVVSMRR